MRNFSRRNFIKVGASALSIPFLESMPFNAYAATAQASGSLKRVIFITISNSWHAELIFPQNPAYLTGAEGVRYLPLNSITGDISKMFTASKYGSIKNKMNLMRGFDLLSAAQGGGGHRNMIALGATDERSSSATKATIDTIIAGSSAFYPVAPFRKIMNAAATNGGDTYRYNYTSNASALEGPTEIFNDFFKGNTLPGGGTTTTPPDSNLTRRLSMTGAMSKLNAMASSARFSAADQQKLKQHADLINQLLPSLVPPSGGGVATGAGCIAPGAPAGINESINSTSGNGKRLQVAMDLIYMALNCQLTNVVTFHPVIAADDSVCNMDDHPNDDPYHQHIGHANLPTEYLQKKGFVLDKILYLASLMDATKESNGLSMLDNSLIVVVSNDGTGTHTVNDMCAITFGSLGGAIKTGNYINYQRTDAKSWTDGFGVQEKIYYGRPYNSLFTTILNALKIPHSGFGEYAGDTSNHSAFITAAAKLANLPILT